MAIEQVISVGFIRGGQSTISQTINVSEEGETNRDVAITGAQTNVAIGWTADISEMRSLCMMASKTCTIRTNSTGTPQETFTLTENVPFIWADDMPIIQATNIFLGDVTNVYVTTTEDTRVQFYATFHVAVP